MSVFGMLLTATKSGPTPPVLNHDIQGYSKSHNRGFYINLNGPIGPSYMINTDNTGYWYFDIPSGVTLTSLYEMFHYETHLTSIYFNNTIDTSNVTVTSNMFYGCSGLTTISGLENLDLSNSTTTASMFEGCSSLTSINNLSIDLSSCTTMDSMFENCTSLVSIDLNGLINSDLACNNMKRLFRNCSSLTNVNFGSFGTDRALTFEKMFEGCSSLLSIDLSMLNTENVESFTDCFKDCNSLVSVKFGMNYSGGIDISKVYFFSGMFDGCSSLETINIDMSSWSMQRVSSTARMFKNCSSLLYIPSYMFNGTGNKLRNSSYMFYGCSSLNNINGTELNTHYITDMSHMFEGCIHFGDVWFFTRFDTSSCTDMSYMFRGCTSLYSWINPFPYNTSLVENISYMFDGCIQIQQLELSSWDLNSVDVTDQTKYESFVPNISTLNVQYTSGNIPSEIRALFPNVNWTMSAPPSN